MTSERDPDKRRLRGSISVPGDKSISHRSIMFGSIAEGTSHIHGFLPGEDCLSTINSFKALGIQLESHGSEICVHGSGLYGLKAPSKVLDMGNSGTTTRLICGILSAQDFSCTLSGDASLNSRPMSRIIIPLSQMGASIKSIHGNNCAPLLINGRKLHAVDYFSPVASAQVKSAVLLAGLYADGTTSVTEPFLSRDHTEHLLRSFGAEIISNGNTASVNTCKRLTAQEIYVPGDISSAAYFIVSGLIVPNSEITIRNVGVNPTRAGILEVCRRMGASFDIENLSVSGGEETADITVRSSELTGTEISGALIPSLIDELPVIAVMACRASGTTVIKDAAELKVKESNRIESVVANLKAMGADIEATSDGMIIRGGHPLTGTYITAQNDHRIVMALSVAALIASGNNTYDTTACVDVSYPGFFQTMESIVCP